MPIVWNLKKWLAVERDIYRPAELQALLEERAGIILSHQAISALINGKPSALRMQTIQSLCNALDCKLSDFCDVLPDTDQELKRQRKAAGDRSRRLYPGQAPADRYDSPFPTPFSYYDATTSGTVGDQKKPG